VILRDSTRISSVFFLDYLLMGASVPIIPFTYWRTREGSLPAGCSSLFLVAGSTRGSFGIMADTPVLATHPRKGAGTREAAKVRKNSQVPAIVYGHKETPETIAVAKDALAAALRHHSFTLDLEIGGKKQSVLIKDVQYDHLGKEVLHVDFLRVSATDKIHVAVPVELRGIPVGAKGGGVLIQPLHNLHIECLVSARPDSIRVKIDDLQVGQAIHVRELVIPDGVKVLHDPEAVVVQVKVPAQAEAAVGGLEGATTAEPEIITKKKEKDDETEE